MAMVNRFVSAKEMKEIEKGLEDGTIDIVVGTHRLFNQKIKYKDLGLLIIDEEQRFGVEHKEKIKEMKNNIDVLSLSATPIPRTMQMSLIGVRTISQLNTPPAQRHPIQTYVMEKEGRQSKRSSSANWRVMVRSSICITGFRIFSESLKILNQNFRMPEWVWRMGE